MDKEMKRFLLLLILVLFIRRESSGAVYTWDGGGSNKEL